MISLEARTFPQLLRAAAAAYGEEAAVALAGETLADDIISFAGLERRSAILARGLIAQGLGKGARIGFIYGNGPDFAITLAAIARIGAVAVPMSTLLKAEELVRVVRQSDIGGLIVQRRILGHDMVERLSEALPELREAQGARLRIARTPYLRWIATNGADLPPAFRSLEWLTETAEFIPGTLLAAIEAEVHSTDQMIEIYTSGSMALPKGVKHLHGPVIFRARILADMLGITRGKDVNAMLPMFWVGGLMMALLPGLHAGAKVNCTERTMNSSRHAMGSVLADQDLEAMRANKPWWGLGMSETLGPYSWGDEFRAPGRPICAPLDNIAQGYEVRLVNEENQPVADGETGEIQLRGYPVTPGLHKFEPESCFTPDGFYRTGDMGLRDGQRIHFVGRDGDMIKTAGSNVSPAEVEMELQAIEGIASAYVVGLPDDKLGQLVAAAIVAGDDHAPDFASLEAELKKRISSYKVPRAWLAITREEIPMLPSNKVARRQIAAMLAERLGRG